MPLEISVDPCDLAVDVFVELIFDNSNMLVEIINKNGELIYLSPRARDSIKGVIGKDITKGNMCFRDMHNRDSPCSGCVAFRSLELKDTVTDVLEFWGKKFRMTGIPLFDNGATAVLVFAEEVEQ